MKDKDPVKKPHAVHHMDPHSIEFLQLCARKQRMYAGKIVGLLAEGPANTRTLAERLDCYPSSITKAVFDMRQQGIIGVAGEVKDPRSGRPTYLWQLEPRAEDAATATGSTATLAEDCKDMSDTAQSQPTKKTRRRKAHRKGKE